MKKKIILRGLVLSSLFMFTTIFNSFAMGSNNMGSGRRDVDPRVQRIMQRSNRFSLDLYRILDGVHSIGNFFREYNENYYFLFDFFEDLCFADRVYRRNCFVNNNGRNSIFLDRVCELLTVNDMGPTIDDSSYPGERITPEYALANIIFRTDGFNNNEDGRNLYSYFASRYGLCAQDLAEAYIHLIFSQEGEVNPQEMAVRLNSLLLWLRSEECILEMNPLIEEVWTHQDYSQLEESIIVIIRRFFA